MFIVPIISSFYPCLYNYSIKLFLDAMFLYPSPTIRTIITPIFIFLATNFIIEIMWRVSDIAEWKAEPFVRRSILLSTYEYVQNHHYLFFQENLTGIITSKIQNILNGYNNLWNEIQYGLIPRILKTFVNLCALLIVDINLGIFISIFGVLYSITIYKLSMKLNHFAYKEAESRNDLIGIIADKITNITSIFAFSSKKRELHMLDEKILNEFIPRQTVVYKYDFVIQIISGTFYLIMISFVLFYMIYLRFSGLISIGDFSFVFGIILVIVNDMREATTSLQHFSHSLGDLNSSISILYLPQQILDLPNALPLVINQPQIEFNNVSFGYHNKDTIIKNINLIIKPGEKIGIIGSSGAGKTTLINLLLKYFTPLQGQILIDNKDIANVTQESLRNNISIIPQDILLFHRTVMENIRYGNPYATNEEVIEAAKKAHIHDFILTLPEQYNTYVGERGIKLSGGQRQRIAIARAILKDSPILILDEATASLDNQTENLIQNSIDLFIKNKKKTIIAIAHRLSTLRYMDRILLLKNGTISEDGKKILF